MLHIALCTSVLVMFQLGNLQEAADDCTKAIELDEKYVKAYARRAKT